MEDKYFIITVDTEGDNLWGYKEGDVVRTNNAEYIPRFQQLCEKYGFKPVYLTNYEMAMNDNFVREARKWLDEDKCEIGIHLHAWNNPPIYNIKGVYDGNPYLIEYPEKIMREKFQVVYNAITERFGVKPISHRAGRWAMNELYFKILEDYNIKVDCSFTPHINWENVKGKTIGGSDYSHICNGVQRIGQVLEIPMSVFFTRKPFGRRLKGIIKSFLKGNNIWMRPVTSSLEEMVYIIEKVRRSNINYIEFMVHSSELMAGGSPYYPDVESIEELYDKLDSLFAYISKRKFKGVTIKEYCNISKVV